MGRERRAGAFAHVVARSVAVAFAFGAASTTALAADPPSSPSPAQPSHAPPLVFVADPHMGMEGGVRSLDSLGRVVFRYEEAIPPLVAWDERRPAEAAAAVALRFAKLVFLDEPIAELESTATHEVFGHGSRARDLGGTAEYALRLPGIYCAMLSPHGSDACVSTTPSTTSIADPDRTSLLFAGGIEANALESFWIDERMVASGGALHHADLLVYPGKLVYASSFLSRDLETPGKLTPGSNDVDHWVSALQDRYDRPTAAGRATIASRVRTAYLWNLLDPMLVFAAYGTVRHVATGERTLRFPLPQAFGVDFYPTPRFVPSPFGAESYLDVFLGRRGVVVDVYGRVATSGLARAVGGGLRAFGVRVHERVTLGAELDLWDQPILLPDVHALYERPRTIGVNGGVSADVRVVGAIGATARLAWKSRGFLTGQPVDEGPYGFVGASIALE